MQILCLLHLPSFCNRFRMYPVYPLCTSQMEFVGSSFHITRVSHDETRGLFVSSRWRPRLTLAGEMIKSGAERVFFHAEVNQTGNSPGDWAHDQGDSGSEVVQVSKISSDAVLGSLEPANIGTSQADLSHRFWIRCSPFPGYERTGLCPKNTKEEDGVRTPTKVDTEYGP